MSMALRGAELENDLTDSVDESPNRQFLYAIRSRLHL
jgi:hypothetical protein